MSDIYYSIAADVFALFPDYVRGVVVAREVQNPASPPELIDLLRSSEATVRERLRLDSLTEHPRIASWREAFRAFGTKPSEFRSSIEAMVRRALRDQQLPSINALVDVGNAVSLGRLLPVGGHAIDVLTQDIALRRATGQETFVPMGTDQVERPLAGEVVFVEGDTVLTRRWSWRQANHTLTLPTTTAIEINVDGLPPVTRDEVEDACREIEGLVQRFCGGRIRHEILNRDHPRMNLAV